MKKYFSLAIVGVIALFVAVMCTQAAVNPNSSTVSLECEKTTIKIGESTVCTVSITPVLDGQNEYVTAASIILRPSQYLTLTNFTPNSSLGFVQSSATNAANQMYAYTTSQTAVTTGKKAQVFSFTATLSEEARNLSNTDDCAQICIDGVQIGTNLGTTPSSLPTNATGSVGTCYNPAVTEDPGCVGEECNPKTGAFMNYMLIGAIGLASVGAIVVARKSNKFYRV